MRKSEVTDAALCLLSLQPALPPPSALQSWQTTVTSCSQP